MTVARDLLDGIYEPGALYLVEVRPMDDDTGALKIGWTRHDFPIAGVYVQRRYERRFAIRCAVRVRWLHRGTRYDETQLHKACTPWRAAGREWYEPDIWPFFEGGAPHDGIALDEVYARIRAAA